MASIDRTAYPRFKRVVSAREIAESFTPSEDETAWVRSKTTSDDHLLALTVLLKCYQPLGYFPKPADVPEAVVTYVHGALGIAESVAAVNKSSGRCGDPVSSSGPGWAWSTSRRGCVRSRRKRSGRRRRRKTTPRT